MSKRDTLTSKFLYDLEFHTGEEAFLEKRGLIDAIARRRGISLKKGSGTRPPRVDPLGPTSSNLTATQIAVAAQGGQRMSPYSDDPMTHGRMNALVQGPPKAGGGVATTEAIKEV